MDSGSLKNVPSLGPSARIYQSANIEKLMSFIYVNRQRSSTRYANTQKNEQDEYKDLLDQYQKTSNEYRNEEFTQQSEMFLSRIAAHRKSITNNKNKSLKIWFNIVPKELSKYPIFQILVTLSKVFK